MDRTLDVRSRQEWRAWLAQRHDAETEVWLVFHKVHTGVLGIGYEEAVEEAVCFGWVDSLVRRIDDDRYARRFTPRKSDSAWSTSNRRRFERMAAAGLLTEAGLARSPTARSGDAPRVSLSAVPAYIEQALRADARAWAFFEELAPSYRRAYVGWIDAAKRTATREKRLKEAVARLAAGRQLGLK